MPLLNKSGIFVLRIFMAFLASAIKGFSIKTWVIKANAIEIN